MSVVSDIREFNPTARTMSRGSDDGQVGTSGASIGLPTSFSELISGLAIGSEPLSLGNTPFASQGNNTHPNSSLAMQNANTMTSRELIGALEQIEDTIRNVWEPNRMRENELLESYREMIPRSLVQSAAPSVRRRLRDFLRDNGVPIRYGTGIQIHRALLELLPEETPPDPRTTYPSPAESPPDARSTRENVLPQSAGLPSEAIYTQAQIGYPTPPMALSQTPPAMPQARYAINPYGEEQRAPNPNAYVPRSYPPPHVPSTDGTAAVSSGTYPGANWPYRTPPRGPPEDRHRGWNRERDNYANVAATRDLLKLYSSPSSKYGGMMSENLFRHRREFEMHCLSLKINPQTALENIYIIFKNIALEYYFSNVRTRAHSISEVFEMMKHRFISEDRRQRSLMMWQTITFKDCKEGSADDRETLAKLVNRAVDLQGHLDLHYQSDVYLRDMLLRATSTEPFAAMIHLHPPNTSTQLIERLNMSIDARKRISESACTTITSNAKQTFNETPAFANEFFVPRKQASHHRHATDMFNRRHAKSKYVGPHPSHRKLPNSKMHDSRESNRRKNPIDRRTGKVMRCRCCGSEYHFLRDCKEVSPTQLVYYLANMMSRDDAEPDPEQLLDDLQDMSGEPWNGEEIEGQSAKDETEDDSGESLEIFHNMLADKAVQYALCPSEEDNIPSILLTGVPETPFEGIVMDHGAENTVGGIRQYKAYCDHTKLPPKKMEPSQKSFKFGDQVVTSLGIARIRFPTDDAGSYFEYPSDIVNIDIPLLFGLDSMKRFGTRVDEVENKVTSKDHGWSASLTYKNGHLYREWPGATILFNRAELEKLHRRFAHPSVEKLMNLLRRAKPTEVDSQTAKILQEITDSCDPCQRLSPKPYVFQVSMPDAIQFNHEVIVDLMWIDKEPVLHVVDRGTHFSSATFLPNESATTVWNSLIKCWISVYVGFPNVISHDQGTVFTSKLFKNALEHFGVVAKPVPIEAHNALSVGERYHGPLRRIYTKIRIEYPSLDKHVALSVAIMALNNTAGPEGLTPTLLVFGTIPKLPVGHIETLMPSQRDRFRALEFARREMETITAELRVKIAQKNRSASLEILDLDVGDPVLVYRERTKKWEGPFKFVSQDGKTVKVQPPRGNEQEFSVSAVKPYQKSSTLHTAMREALRRIGCLPVNRNSPRESDVYSIIIIKDPNDRRFDAAKKNEINGLLNRGAFELVHKSLVPKGANILRGRFVLAIKEPDTDKETLKARFVIQGHRDREKKTMVKESPTVLRHSIRLLVALASIFNYEVWTRDVKQAYIQSMEDLFRDIYLEPPTDVGIDEEHLLKIVKPVYGLTDSGSYWWLTSKNYHVNDLEMDQSAMDPCLFYKLRNGSLQGIEASLVDDTLSTGNEDFMRLEEEKSKKFDVKEREQGSEIQFSGCIITRNPHNFLISQQRYTKKLRTIPKDQWNEKNFASLRGKVSWITNTTRPDSVFCTSYLSQKRGENITEEDFKLLNATVRHLVKNERGLIYPKMDLSSLRIYGYADAAFAGNADLSSQLGMIILLCDNKHRCAIIHYNSWKCQRVTRSVLAAEVHAFASCFDFAFAVKHDLERMIGGEVPIVMFTDSKCLFDTITKLSKMTEKRLLIDIAALRESYVKGELFNVGHISSEYNLADPLTKKTKSDLLTEVMTCGTVSHPVNQWIIHREREELLNRKDVAPVKRKTGGCNNNGHEVTQAPLTCHVPDYRLDGREDGDEAERDSVPNGQE